MVKVFVKARTFRLEALDGGFTILTPNAFHNVDDKFTHDITFRMAVKAGDIEVYETKQQGEAIEKAAFEAPAVPKRSTKKKAADAE